MRQKNKGRNGVTRGTEEERQRHFASQHLSFWTFPCASVFIPALLFSTSAFLLLSLCLSASTFLNLPLCLCLYSCLFIFYLWHLCSAFNCYSVSAFAFLPLVFLLLFLPLPFCLYLLGLSLVPLPLFPLFLFPTTAFNCYQLSF